MRRLGRWLLNALTVLSLLLCAAAAGLWVRSYWVGDDLRDKSPAHEVALGSCRGRVALGFTWPYAAGEELAALPNEPLHHSWRAVSEPYSMIETKPGVVRDWRVLGFRWFRSVGQRRANWTSLPQTVYVVPHAFLTAVFCVLPWLRARSEWRRPRRPVAGHCPRCGYDLTGNVSGVCPECGTAILRGNA